MSVRLWCGVFKGCGVCVRVQEGLFVVCVQSVCGVDKVISARRSACQGEEVQIKAGERREKR